MFVFSSLQSLDRNYNMSADQKRQGKSSLEELRRKHDKSLMVCNLSHGKCLMSWRTASSIEWTSYDSVMLSAI
jgi:hypothetical protein